MTDAEEIRGDEDREHVLLSINGDLDAFELLVDKYEKRMFNIAYRIAGDLEDAAEIVQDAFFSAHRNLKNFEQKSRFSTWLYSITVNTAKNRLAQARARNRHETCCLDDPPSHEEGKKNFELSSREPSALNLLINKDRQKSVQKCLSRLDQDFRSVIVLRDIQGFSYAEIGDMLAIAEGTVKSRLFRARDAVRDCLKKLLGDW